MILLNYRKFKVLTYTKRILLLCAMLTAVFLTCINDKMHNDGERLTITRHIVIPGIQYDLAGWSLEVLRMAQIEERFTHRRRRRDVLGIYINGRLLLSDMRYGQGAFYPYGRLKPLELAIRKKGSHLWRFPFAGWAFPLSFFLLLLALGQFYICKQSDPGKIGDKLSRFSTED